jgi:predicted alpha/beta-fold hydrolase
MSAPFQTQGFNKIYNWNLASSLKKIFLKHQPLWRTYQGPGQPERVPHVNTIREFDEAITVHSFGEWGVGDAGAARCGHLGVF